MKKPIKPHPTAPATARQAKSSYARRAAPAPSPAVAGFRPAGVALAAAAAFMGAGAALGQPTGAHVTQGQAQLSQQGNALVVTTQNAAGTNRSAIDWQSFSIPAGSTTRFDQPSAQSLSINRVVGNDPSAIFGTLSSNGRLVLVNPSGITVGAGAVVDTAGFTASTLRMSDADALAGRLAFGDGTAGGGVLKVDGSIVARSGDVVLIAPNVQVGSQALVQAPNGATLLAAGQKVELTGRGLEGIVMQVQAPDNSAVNFGTLQGDAVGIFAGTLKHSGLVQANAVSTEGGKVVLKAQGDALVDGAISARAGAKGGSVDVLGDRVGLTAGATIDASGPAGGGYVRIGGDFHGANPDVPNAQRTYVDPTATIHADATQSGDGGKIAVWADEQTQGYGTITARGGAQGGDGGFVEVSGKHNLAFDAKVDTRASLGKTGTLLLDPDSINITSTGTDIYTAPLAFGDLPGSTLFLNATSVGASTTNVDLEATQNITFSAPVSMVNANVGLSAKAGGTISVLAPITTQGGAIFLSAGDSGTTLGPASSALNVQASLDTTGGGTVPTGAAITLRSRLSDVSGTSIRIIRPAPTAPPVSIDAGSADLQIDGQGAIVSINNAVLKTNGGAIDIAAAFGQVEVASNSTVASGGGAISIQAGQSLASTSRAGVVVDLSSVDAGSGTIQITGTTAAPSSWGVDFLNGGSTLRAAGGTTVIGTNTGTGLFAAGGVRVAEDNQPMTFSGPVSITGTALDAGGTGVFSDFTTLSFDSAVSIVGNGGSSGAGVQINGFGRTIGVAAGGLSITGNSVHIQDGTIQSADNSSVSLTATAGTLDLSNTSISSNGGAITLAGAEPTALANGVVLNSSTVTAGAGSITVMGATPITSGFAGVNLLSSTFTADNFITIGSTSDLALSNTSIGTTSGAITLTGDGTIFNDSTVTSASGSITVLGAFSSGSGFGGVSLATSTLRAGDAVTIASTGGNLSLFSTLVQNTGSGPLALSATSTGGARLTIDSVSSLQQAGSADLSLAADSMTLSGVISAVNARTVITPTSSTRGISIGGTDDGSHLTLDTTALTGIATGELVIGGTAFNGGLDVLAPLTLTSTNALSLLQGPSGTIGQASGAVLTVPGLNASGGGVALAEANSVQLLSGGANAGGFSFNNVASGLAIGTVDGTNGIQATGGTILVTTPGTLQLTQPVVSDAAAGSNAITLIATDLSTSGAGDLQATNDRWAVFLQGPPGAGLAGSPVSGNNAVWNRSFSGSTASSLPTEAGNRYVFAFQPSVTISADPATKVYDSTDVFTGLTATVTGIPDASLSGNVFNQDVVGVTLNPSIGFKNVGVYTGAITLSSATLPSGYSSSIGFVAGDATITPATLTLAAQSDSRTYDATTNSALLPTISGLFGGDTVTSLTQSFDSKNAGARTLSVNGGFVVNDGNGGGNYTVSLVGAGGSITPATLTVGGLSANNKVYDATTAATFAGTATASGVLAGDTVAISGGGSGFFADKNAGTGKAVTLDTTSLSLTGLDAGNYVIASSGGYTANITPAALTLSAQSDSRTYDATTNSALLPTISGLSAGDTVSSLTQSFDSKNAGARTLSINGGFVVNDGNGGGNYTVSTATAAGSITPASLTLAAQSDSRTYDTTTNSALLPTISGLFGGDTVTSLTQSFDSKNAGARTLSVNGGFVVSDGNGGGNYTVSTATAAGSITPASLTLAAQSDSRTYDTTTNSALLPTTSGLFGGDTVTSLTQSFDSKNAGARTLSVNGGFVVSDGNGGGNYTVSTATAAGSITPASLTLAAQSDSRTYDATTGSAALPTISGLFGGDTVTSLTQSFDSKNAGSRTLLVNGSYVLNDGNGGGNYTVSLVGAGGSITPATLTISGLSANDKTYDATTVATLSGSPTLTGVFAGDSVAFSATPTAFFSDKNVGVAKPVTVSATGSLAGTDAGNYVLVAPTGLSASITPAPLTITANNQSKQQGTAFNFTGSEISVAGLQGGEQVSSASLSSAGAPAGAAFGNYAINAGGPLAGGNGFAASNYLVTYQPGTLSVLNSGTTQQVDNMLVTFLQLFNQANAPDAADKSSGDPDIVVTDTSCKPS